MAMTKCRECGNDISSKATTCPHCGNPTESETKGLGCFIVVLVLAILMIAGSIASKVVDKQSKAGDNTAAWSERHADSEAIVNMREFVRQNLKCPSTAEFPSALSGVDSCKYLGDQTYQISSYVDSQNKFGAMVRTYYTGEVQQVSEHDWKLLNLNAK